MTPTATQDKSPGAALSRCGCGSQVYHHKLKTTEQHKFRCPGCGVQTGYFATEAEARDCWNAAMSRAQPAQELVEALEQAEACMSIVEPRSGKAEYLRILDVVRSALSRARSGG